MPKVSTANPQMDDEVEAVDEWRQRLKQVPAPRPARAKAIREPAEPPRTIGQAAEELGLSVWTVRQWVAERRLAHLRLGRAIRIPAAEIRRIIEESTIPRAGTRTER